MDAAAVVGIFLALLLMHLASQPPQLSRKHLAAIGAREDEARERDRQSVEDDMAAEEDYWRAYHESTERICAALSRSRDVPQLTRPSGCRHPEAQPWWRP